MVNATLSERNIYEDFDLEADILYFRTGAQGLVSFHGRNYNIKKRMTAEQLQALISNQGFYAIGGSCYINIGKIKTIDSGTIYFDSEITDSRQMTVNRRKQYVIQQLFIQRVANRDLRMTP
jgi:transcriptional regulator CtsR